MNFRETSAKVKEKFDAKWKETTMKLKIDIAPEDLFSFDKMIAMPAIKVMYVAGLMCVAIFGLALMFHLNFQDFCIGIGVLLIGSILWRIICETAIVVFGIYDRLGEIRNAVNRMEEDHILFLSKKNKAQTEKKNSK